MRRLSLLSAAAAVAVLIASPSFAGGPHSGKGPNGYGPPGHSAYHPGKSGHGKRAVFPFASLNQSNSAVVEQDNAGGGSGSNSATVNQVNQACRNNCRIILPQ